MQKGSNKEEIVFTKTTLKAMRRSCQGPPNQGHGLGCGYSQKVNEKKDATKTVPRPTARLRYEKLRFLNVLRRDLRDLIHLS